MRSVIIVRRRGAGYIADVSDAHGNGPRGLRIGLTPEDAALRAAGLMVEYARSNPEGGDLMAPEAVMSLIPQGLRSVG